MKHEQTVIIPLRCVFARCGCMWWTVPKSTLKKLKCLGCGLKLVEVTDNDCTKPENFRLIYSKESILESKRYSKGTEQQIRDANERNDKVSGHDPNNNDGELGFGE